MPVTSRRASTRIGTSGRGARRSRIERAAHIVVEVSDLTAEIVDDGRVATVFHQRYESDSYSDEVIKTLEWISEDGEWRIARERSVPRPLAHRR